MSQIWNLAEVTELDLRMRPSSDPVLPENRKTDQDLSRPDVLLHWLRDTRDSDPEGARIAFSAMRAELWLRLAILIFSAITGAGAAAALLQYGGDQLINVSAYLGVLVGGQLLLLLFLLLSSLWVRFHRGIREELFLPKIIRELPNPQSLTVWRWRLFTTFQWGGVAFNCGILAATLWKVVSFDLAFGWATTLRVDAETVAALVRILSVPWGGATAPTLSQVESSRIVLLEGFSSVDPDSTAAWWPFLMLCVTVYGLIPRLLLSFLGMGKVHALLKHPALSSPETEHLYQRLTRRTLRYHTGQESSRPDRPEPSELTPLAPTQPLQLELPEDLRNDTDVPALIAQLRSRLQVEVTEEEQTGKLFVVEAWQPPLEETLRFFRRQREEAGADADFILLAVGLPSLDGELTSPTPENLSIWNQKLASLHDPRLGLIAWEEPS